MSKQVLTNGFFNVGEIGYGLVSGSVDRNPTRVDASDTNNNNELLVGRKVWVFVVTVISDNLRPLIADGVTKTISIGLGDDFYVGNGKVLSVNHQGQIDQKVIYNVSGEFLPNAYYGIDEVNGLYFLDEDGNGTADGYTMLTGSYTWTFDSGGAHLDFSGSFDDIYRGENFENSVDHIRFCRYRSSNLSALQMDAGASSAILSGDTAGVVTDYFDTFVTSASDDQNGLLINLGGTPDLQVYHCVHAKLIDSLT